MAVLSATEQLLGFVAQAQNYGIVLGIQKREKPYAAIRFFRR